MLINVHVKRFKRRQSYGSTTYTVRVVILRAWLNSICQGVRKENPFTTNIVKGPPQTSSDKPYYQYFVSLKYIRLQCLVWQRLHWYCWDILTSPEHHVCLLLPWQPLLNYFQIWNIIIIILKENNNATNNRIIKDLI